LLGSKLNRISGMEAFPCRQVIAGVTHALDDIHIRHGDTIVILPNEYPYHRRIKPNVRITKWKDIREGDVLVMAVPFADYGGLHPETNDILDHAYRNNVPVHLDGAWYGCLRDFSFDYGHPAVQSVAFSLSKGLGLGANRIGVRYARERWDG